MKREIRRGPTVVSSIVKPVFVATSTIAWILAAPYATRFLGWSANSVNISYYIAFLGAVFSYLMGRSQGQLRKVIYDSAFSGYVDLVLVLAPLVIIYIVLIKAFALNFPYLEAIASTAISSPFVLVSAWVFSFTVYIDAGKALHHRGLAFTTRVWWSKYG